MNPGNYSNQLPAGHQGNSRPINFRDHSNQTNIVFNHPGTYHVSISMGRNGSDYESGSSCARNGTSITSSAVGRWLVNNELIAPESRSVTPMPPSSPVSPAVTDLSFTSRPRGAAGSDGGYSSFLPNYIKDC